MQGYPVPYLVGIGSANFVTPYWGSQALNAFPEEIETLMRECKRYVDLTAGGGGDRKSVV